MDYPYQSVPIAAEAPRVPDIAKRYASVDAQWQWVGWAAFVMLLCAANFLVVLGLCRGGNRAWVSPLAVLSVGVLLAQFPLLPAWLAWGRGNYAVRVAAAIGTALLLYGHVVAGFCLGTWMDGRGSDITSIREFLLVMPLVLPTILLAGEFPLRLLRFFFGWRFISAADDSLDRPLAIRDLLLATVVVGLALGAARLAHAVAGTRGGFWPGLGIASGSAALVSLLTVLPLAWRTMISNLFVRVVALAGYVVIAASAGFAILVASVGMPPYGAWFLLGFHALSLGFTFAIVAAFWLARRQGYRLQTRHRPAGGG